MENHRENLCAALCSLCLCGSENPGSNKKASRINERPFVSSILIIRPINRLIFLIQLNNF